ncbi:ferrochelatase, mitochondrial [Diaphorina citri]|uniref:Ferrochelatase n=1 Tax=Diaphorina citri TaxID=121845 RepID=A0A3Q0JLD9_DIACI|nr:ferrochelatase, mitochondrial [Diaphorina citri]
MVDVRTDLYTLFSFFRKGVFETGSQAFRKPWSRLFSIQVCNSQASPSTGAKDSSKPKTAILMLNMGGPTHTDQVSEYLHRIMTDRDMIQLPVQGKLGPYIARRRTPEVQKKYQEIGGGSPILKWTQLQGEKMANKLNSVCPEYGPHKHYVAFRYADPPRTAERVVVIFSQVSSVKLCYSGSSLNAIYTHFKQKVALSNIFAWSLIDRWQYTLPCCAKVFAERIREELKQFPVEVRKGSPSNISWSLIDRWSTHPLLCKVFAERIQEELKQFPAEVQKDVIILFSAHSLPLRAVNRGDPYPSEVGATVQGVMQELNNCNPYHLVWQSKVGPLPWLGPFTDDALKGYVKQGKKNFLLVPIAFVNEHIETLHEMDIEYCHDLGKEVSVFSMYLFTGPYLLISAKSRDKSSNKSKYLSLESKLHSP